MRAQGGCRRRWFAFAVNGFGAEKADGEAGECGGEYAVAGIDGGQGHGRFVIYRFAFAGASLRGRAPEVDRGVFEAVEAAAADGAEVLLSVVALGECQRVAVVE